MAKALILKKVFSILTLVFALCSKAQTPFRFGVNLDDQGAFVNIINHTNRYSKAVGFDSLGWPVSDFDLVLLDGRPATEWSGSIDDPEEYRINYSGRYKCAFKGLANVSVSGTSVSIENKTHDAASNTTYFDLVIAGFPGANHGLTFLSFTGTQRTSGSSLNSGITALKVNRPGYPLNGTKVFTDEYIALCKAASFNCYRFYNLQNIWDGEPTFPAKTKWSFRKTAKDASQRTMANLNGKRDGWCWEYIVALSNILKKDIWINIHMSCDSAYVVELASYLKNNLDPGINIYVENSNEVWSPTQATHGPYNQAEAVQYKITFDQNYARRSVELSKWFGQVYGLMEINKKIRIILAGQHVYPGRSENHLNYIKNQFGEPKNFIYANSTALYFGSSNAASPDTNSINEGMKAEIAKQVSDSLGSLYRLNHIRKARSWNLPGGCTSYEGGPHLPAGGGTSNLDAQIMSHRTVEMGKIVELNYIEAWKNIGGGLAMYFTLSSAYNRYGCWGLTDDHTNPYRNYKMKAAQTILAKTASAGPNQTVSKYEIFPNPFFQNFRIHSLASDHWNDGEIHLFDVYGRMIPIEIKQETQTSLIAGGYKLPNGVYFLKVDQDIHKLIKKD